MTTAQNKTLHDSTEAELDASSLSAIRSILTEETVEEKKSVRSGVKLPRPVAGLRRKADALPPLEAPIADPDAAVYAERVLSPKPKKRRLSLGRKKAAAQSEITAKEQPVASEKFGGFRLKPAYVALAAIALLVILRPWLVFGLLFIFLFIMVGVFLIVGYDGFWQGVMKAARWYANRRPERAAIMHARLDRFAMRWDAVLDRFPEGMVDALYLPDFGELAAADLRHDEAMERRLSGMQGKGA